MNRSQALLPFVLLAPRTAGAHAPVEGAGDFYGGLLHPLTVPEHLITLIALGLLLGHHSTAPPRQGLIAFGFALPAGMLLVDSASSASPLTVPLLTVALTLGLFCAAAPALPALACAALAGATAMLLGADSAIDNLRGPGALALLAGSALSAALMVFYLAALTERLQQTWQRIGVRIVGSWTAASALLVLVLQFARFSGER